MSMTVDAQALIATAARLLKMRGSVVEVDILVQSSPKMFGTYWDDEEYWSLELYVDVAYYEKLKAKRVFYENHICSVIEEIIDERSVSTRIRPRIEVTENWREELQTLSNSQFGLPDPNPHYATDVFMLIPFENATLDEVYHDHILKVVHGQNWTITRADDFFTNRTMFHEIWSAINAAKLIIADCTGRNANVFYELGIAQTLGKPNIPIAQDVEDIPSDLKQTRIIEYKPTPRGLEKFESDLLNALQKLMPYPSVDEEPNDMNDIPF
jgi:hypothetical protein